MPTTTPTPYPCEWFHNRNGVQHYWTDDEIDEVEERMKKVPAAPDNVTSIEDVRASRTTGGKKGWSMKGAGR